jgi:hypothetical protein
VSGPFDGYGNLTTRDTSAVAGGKPGFVNTAYTVKTVTGTKNASFEWNALALLDNYADSGENCSRYAKAVRYGKGGTWGDCIEVQDETTNPGPVVGLEVDMFVQGPDTGSRVGIDIVVGDSSYDNGGAKQNAVASFGIRMGAFLSNAWAKFRTGIWIQDVTGTGVQVGTPNDKMQNGVAIAGQVDCAINASGAITKRFFAINSGGGSWVTGNKMGVCVGGIRVSIDGNEYAMGLFAIKP